MTEDEVVALLAGMDGVTVRTAGPDAGAPEVAWGDTFCYDDPDDQRMPFATVVVHDYAGWDTATDLNRDGVFRVNIAVGRERYSELLGHPAPEHDAHSGEYDYTALDVLLPHPMYASQGWVSVLNPGERTAAQLPELLESARSLAAGRRERRSDPTGR